MRTIIFFAYLYGYMIVHPFRLMKGLKALKAGDFATADAIAEKNVSKWCNTLIKLSGSTITVTGSENIPQDRPVVFIANHRSMYDIPMMLTQLGKPISLVSKIEVQKLPYIRKWMELLHCLFLDRQDPRQGMRIIGEAAELVKKGYSVGIFPEGTRSKGEEGDLLPFMAGAFRIAFNSKAPIVPVVMFRTRECLEADGHFTIKPAKLAVHILPPVETAEMTRQDLKTLPEEMEALFRKELAAGLEAGL